MSLDVSTWFATALRATHLAPTRRFLLGGSDYSASVLRWPRLRFRATNIDLGTTTITLENHAGGLLFLTQSGALPGTTCEISLGLTHPQSGTEFLSLYTGTPSHLRYEQGGQVLRLMMQGKTRSLTQITLGTEVTSEGIDYTGSAWYPADMAWSLLTSHGGLSSVASTSNPDIDYASWLQWQDADDVRDVRVQGYFTGEKLYQAIQDLAVMDSRGVGFHNSRIRFSDMFDAQQDPVMELDPDWVVEQSLSISPDGVVNEFAVDAGYDPATGKYDYRYVKTNTASVVDYGLRSGRFSGRGLWFYMAKEARYLAEDQVRAGRQPLAALQVRCPLTGALTLTPGDVVTVTASHLGLAGARHRLMQQEIDLDDARMDLLLEQAVTRAWAFQATVCSESLRPESMYRDPGGVMWACAEGAAPRLYRTDSGGVFQPMDAHAYSVLPLDGQTLLLGGMTADSGGILAMQRSSDGGSSSVVVASLGAAGSKIHHIYRTQGGACLASANSGQILRSIDAGSSWSITQTISPGYHINRFYEPVSGTVWGGTGYNGVIVPNLYLYVSTDDGQSWVEGHQVRAGSGFFALDLMPTPDSETLIFHSGLSLIDLGVSRSSTTSPGSIAWTQVLSLASFLAPMALDSNHLLGGFLWPYANQGGLLHRSHDAGSSWVEDARLTKVGNIRLFRNEDGSADAYVSRAAAIPRTDRYHKADPEAVD